MTDDLDRRLFLKRSAAFTTLAALGLPAEAFADGGPLTFGAEKPFSFDAVVERAKALASQAYVPPERPAPEVTTRLDYGKVGQIKFKIEDALWADGPPPFPATFFHLGTFFQKRVAISVVEGAKA